MVNGAKNSQFPFMLTGKIVYSDVKQVDALKKLSHDNPVMTKIKLTGAISPRR